MLKDGAKSSILVGPFQQAQDPVEHIAELLVVLGVGGESTIKIAA